MTTTEKKKKQKKSIINKTLDESIKSADEELKKSNPHLYQLFQNIRNLPDIPSVGTRFTATDFKIRIRRKQND